MADNKVENTEVAEEVCCPKEKPEKKIEETTVTPAVTEDKAEKETEEKAENGEAKEENGKETEETENDKEAESDVKACKRKSTAGDAANGVEATTPEKKQKLEASQAEEKETEVAA